MMIVGCQNQDNEKAANSCVAGAPVCDTVDVNRLDRKLADSDEKRIQEQENNNRKSEFERGQRVRFAESDANTSVNAREAKASIAIIAACTGWQSGVVRRSDIMDTAKAIYEKQGFNANSVDWLRAIQIAKSLDAAKGLGCVG
jgi:hypothetical protein